MIGRSCQKIGVLKPLVDQRRITRNDARKKKAVTRISCGTLRLLNEGLRAELPERTRQSDDSRCKSNRLDESTPGKRRCPEASHQHYSLLYSKKDGPGEDKSTGSEQGSSIRERCRSFQHHDCVTWRWRGWVRVQPRGCLRN